MAVFAMEAASIISERSLEISFASALSTVSASGLNVNAGERCCCPFALHDSCGRPLPCICSPASAFVLVVNAADYWWAFAMGHSTQLAKEDALAASCYPQVSILT